LIIYFSDPFIERIHLRFNVENAKEKVEGENGKGDYEHGCTKSIQVEQISVIFFLLGFDYYFSGFFFKR